MADEIIKKVEPIVEPGPTVVKQEEKIDPKQLKTEIMRDLSKELGINVFEAEGLKKVKDLIDSQKTEHEKLQEQLSGYAEKEKAWIKEKLDFQTKLKASELGIGSDYIEDALKLADNNPDKLDEVIKKFPMFKSNKQQVNIGIQTPPNTPPNHMSEAEAFMAKNPIYKGYLNKK